MVEMYTGRRALPVCDRLVQYFLSKNIPSRIDLISAVSTSVGGGQSPLAVSIQSSVVLAFVR